MQVSELPKATRVLVIGGGPVGLTVSGLLSRRGVEHVVVERRRESQRAPAAHVLRRRPMAIFDVLGVGDAIRSAAPRLRMDYITWCTTLGGSEIGRLDLRPVDRVTGERPEEPWTNCPQNRVEPILFGEAVRHPEATIVRGAECDAIAQSTDRVLAQIRVHDGTKHEVTARWAIAADGASSATRRALGIEMRGAGPLARFRMVHFEADLRPWIETRQGPIFWILNPESPGTLIVHDPARSHVFMMPQLGLDEEEQTIPARLDNALGITAQPKILSIDAWSPHVQVAERYRRGRVFLVGDAAHRFPPTGGLGLNTGVEEAYDLVTRIADVEANAAPESLLDGYESARQPAARTNADASFENLLKLGEISRVIGACADLSGLERRVALLTNEEREHLGRAIEAQRGHFLFDGWHPEERSAPNTTHELSRLGRTPDERGSLHDAAATDRPGD